MRLLSCRGSILPPKPTDPGLIRCRTTSSQASPDRQPCSSPVRPGFVGAYLLYELLRQSEATIYCLVRADNVPAGLGRVSDNLARYGLYDEALFTRRVRVVIGALDRPGLGLSPARFKELARTMDMIVHCAALVSFVQPYSVLKPVNVDGTAEVIRLAREERVVPLHHISTLSVFDVIGYFTGIETIRETEDLDLSRDHIHLGYSQSKWVAEKLVVQARDVGLPVTTYRLGIILGHSRNGFCNPDDGMLRILCGCIGMGSVPDLDKQEEVTPVDYACRATAYLMLQEASWGKTYHISNPKTITYKEIFTVLDRLGGISYRLEPYEVWKQELISLAGRGQENPLIPLLPFCVERVADNKTIFELYEGSPYYDCRQTLADLNGFVHCPPPDETLFSVYLNFLKQQGLIRS